jgi:hypothetical protein
LPISEKNTDYEITAKKLYKIHSNAGARMAQ